MDASRDAAEALSRRVARSSGRSLAISRPPDGTARASEFYSERLLQHRPLLGPVRKNVRKPLRVMKFGGTSVGDASCIEKVVKIIRAASRESNIVVVVSAMSGVTNKLIEAATQSEAVDSKRVATIFDELSKQHDGVASALIHSAAERNRICRGMQKIFEEGARLCQRTALRRELTAHSRDSIASLGERLSAPLVAAALAERGVASESIEATELVVTNSDHGSAEPLMNLTRERSEARLRPLLRLGTVPVVTGFIGATAEGVLTTLGRGGSDYSATILGAALEADEVIIWSDVDGLLTADPRLVPGARTIPKISYKQATELAYSGAKVLHPKTIGPLMPAGIPLWIRNTFAPERPGTEITPTGSSHAGGVKGLAAINDVALITLGGPGIGRVRDLFGRTLATVAAVRADALLLQSSPQNDIRFVVSASIAKGTIEALRSEFAQDFAHEKVEHINLDLTVAIVTVVGQNLHGDSGVVGRTFDALDRENVRIIAVAHGSSECNISFVVAQNDVKAALLTAHREFQMDTLNSHALPATCT